MSDTSLLVRANRNNINKETLNKTISYHTSGISYQEPIIHSKPERMRSKHHSTSPSSFSILYRNLQYPQKLSVFLVLPRLPTKLRGANNRELHNIPHPHNFPLLAWPYFHGAMFCTYPRTMGFCRWTGTRRQQRHPTEKQWTIENHLMEPSSETIKVSKENWTYQTKQSTHPPSVRVHYMTKHFPHKTMATDCQSVSS